MININGFTKAGVALAAIVALAVPTVSHAASYAYVDTAGIVREFIADSWLTAINNAPNIAANSGVCLLVTASDRKMIGTRVSSAI